VLTSAVLFLLWVPISAGYLGILRLEANTVFAVFGHGVALESGPQRPQLSYPGVDAPGTPGRQLSIPIYQSIAIHMNIIVLVGLFVATPGMPVRDKVRGIAAGMVLLSLAHVAQIYFISYLFVWDHVTLQYQLGHVPRDELRLFAEEVERGFPLDGYARIETMDRFWNSFVRESAPLLVWFVYYLSGGPAAAPAGRATPRQ